MREAFKCHIVLLTAAWIEIAHVVQGVKNFWLKNLNKSVEKLEEMLSYRVQGVIWFDY